MLLAIYDYLPVSGKLMLGTVKWWIGFPGAFVLFVASPDDGIS